MSKLAVAHGWKPQGETAYTVMNKVQILNALGPQNIKNVFLLDKNTHPKSPASHQFDLPSILRLTGWSSDSLELTFIDTFPELPGARYSLDVLVTVVR